jgi:hypothetical protein
MSEARRSEWWWLAVNGLSVAASAIPSEHVSCLLKPQQFFGFRTREEQLEQQQFLLTAPVPEIEATFREWAARADRGDMRITPLQVPDPPTRGETLWFYQPEATAPVA